MQQADLEKVVLQGAERWRIIKDRQYQLVLPSGVYASDLTTCVLLAEMPGTDEELIARVEQAAVVLARLRAHPSIGRLLPLGGDAAAVLALASIPEDAVVVDAPVAAVVELPVPPALPAPSEPAPCPHCGFGSPDWKEPVKVESVVEERPVLETPTPTAGCEHVGSDGKCPDCTGDRIDDCSACGGSFVACKGRTCKDSEECEHVYCGECADASLNEHCYCEDCATVSCDGCDDEIDRGTQKNCARADCDLKRDYCDECAARLLNADGLCSSCSDEEEEDCSNCNATFTASRLTHCKDAEDCGSAYCDDCKSEHLSEAGYCDECSTVSCDGCDGDVEREDAIACKGDDDDRMFCAACAAHLLSETGTCADCLGEENEDCSDCGDAYISLRLKGCNSDECSNAYCPQCVEANLTRGRCPDCRDED